MSKLLTDQQALQLHPIGVARTPLDCRAQAARQPAAAAGCEGRIELFPGQNFEHALCDLDGWEMIWVLFWFDRNRDWRPKVLPPRSTSGRKGVFATRSPHRPNPIGLSALRLLRIEGLVLHVGDTDLLDGTPVLDIKPYVPYTDAYPAARCGWLEDEARTAHGDTPPDPLPPYAVTLEPLAAAQAQWISENAGLDIGRRIVAALSSGPEPHPYRRIRRDEEALCLAVRDWRVRFAVSGRAVQVLGIRSGYRPSQLAAAARNDVPPAVRAIHMNFNRHWPA